MFFFNCQIHYHRFGLKKRGFVRMNYRYNVSCSETSAENWTQTAVDCYRLGCQCSKCYIYHIYFKNKVFKCKMKDTVIELVRRLGIPAIKEGER